MESPEVETNIAGAPERPARPATPTMLPRTVRRMILGFFVVSVLGVFAVSAVVRLAQRPPPVSGPVAASYQTELLAGLASAGLEAQTASCTMDDHARLIVTCYAPASARGSIAAAFRGRGWTSASPAVAGAVVLARGPVRLYVEEAGSELAVSIRR